MSFKTIMLDDDAIELYRNFSGLEDKQDYTVNFLNEQEQLNEWRKCMVEFVYYLSTTLNSYRLSDTIVKNKEDIKPLMKKLNRLAEIPQQEYL